MHRIHYISGLSVALSLLVSPPQAAAKAESAQSRACWAKATQEGLVGPQRSAFHATCLKGALAPNHPTRMDKGSSAAAAITAPSGADRTTRSQACDAEAARRGLHDSEYQAFRKGCLATAAPVSAVESAEKTTTPTAAKPKLESLTNTPPH
jgi:hypothetical protein